MQNSIEDRVKLIDETLFQHDHIISSLRLKDGFLGLSLFYYLNYQYTQQPTQLLKSLSYVEKAFIGIADVAFSDFRLSDLLDLGRFLSFLQQNGSLEKIEATEHVENIDEIVNGQFNLILSQRDFGSVWGAIAFGNYYLETHLLKDHSVELNTIIFLLESEAIPCDKDGLYWNFTNTSGVKEIKLGLTNGLTGIVNFLSQAYIFDIQREKCAAMIHKAVNFLIFNKRNHGTNLFPDTIAGKEKKYLNYQDLAYGDIGIGNTIYALGDLFTNNHYRDIALKTIFNAARFRDDENIRIRDGALLHGSVGLFSIFDKFQLITGNPEIRRASEYWLEKTFAFGKHKNNWAGFETYYNGVNDQMQLSFAYGLSGIGISLMARGLSNKATFLKFINY